MTAQRSRLRPSNTGATRRQTQCPRLCHHRETLAIALGAALLQAAGGLFADPFIPEMRAHARPRPFAIMPIYDVLKPGGVMPFNRPKAEPEQGAIESVTWAFRPLKLGTSYDAVTGGQQTFADLLLKQPKYLIKAVVADDDGADDFADANGDDQRFGYDRQTGQLVLGWTPDANRSLKLIGISDSIEDHKVPVNRLVNYGGQGGLTIVEGFGQDPVNTDRRILKLTFDDETRYGLIGNLRFELFEIDAERQANNFDLRDSSRAIWNRADVDYNKRGGRIAADLTVAGQTLDVGVGYATAERTALRFGGPTTGGAGKPADLSKISSYQFPGARIDAWKLDATTTFELRRSHSLTAGLRWEHTDATATKADLRSFTPGAGNPTSADLYRTYHGAGVSVDQTHSRWSAKLQWDFDPKDRPFDAFVSLGHSYRAPELQERYFALQSFFAGTNPRADGPIGTSLRSVGNPAIDWELHRRLEGGLTYAPNGWAGYGRKPGAALPWQLRFSTYYDDVKDFISRDRAHGQTPTGVADNARIWRNVDAQLMSLEADLRINLTRRLASRLNLQMESGRNTSDGRDLYGIYPAELNWFLDYRGFLASGGTWSVGSRLRYVAQHQDVDADPRFGSGFDAGATDSYTTLDLYAAVQFNDRVGIRLGVKNVLDEQYAEPHAEDVMDEGSPYLVNAPGRSANLVLVGNF